MSKEIQHEEGKLVIWFVSGGQMSFKVEYNEDELEEIEDTLEEREGDLMIQLTPEGDGCMNIRAETIAAWRWA